MLTNNLILKSKRVEGRRKCPKVYSPIRNFRCVWQNKLFEDLLLKRVYWRESTGFVLIALDWTFSVRGPPCLDPKLFLLKYIQHKEMLSHSVTVKVPISPSLMWYQEAKEARQETDARGHFQSPTILTLITPHPQPVPWITSTLLQWDACDFTYGTLLPLEWKHAISCGMLC